MHVELAISVVQMATSLRRNLAHLSLLTLACAFFPFSFVRAVTLALSFHLSKQFFCFKLTCYFATLVNRVQAPSSVNSKKPQHALAAPPCAWHSPLQHVHKNASFRYHVVKYLHSCSSVGVYSRALLVRQAALRPVLRDGVEMHMALGRLQ